MQRRPGAGEDGVATKAGKYYDIAMDRATVGDGQLDQRIELSGEQSKMSGKLSIVRTDPFLALATNGVTVNNQPALRKGEYFWSTIKTNNTSAAAWLGVTVVSGGNTNIGGLFVPQTPEQFSYDADGNLTNDGRWAYTWDAENRLIQMTVNTNVGPQYQLTFAYDAKGRRIQKVVATNGVAISTNKFLYDGWNLLAELDASQSALRTYMWGTDPSGSQQGAGGVGGLLFIGDFASAIGYYAPAYDGNGNVMALVSMADGTESARYEYGPFGEVIRSTGPMAKANPFRFSTKYQDDESDLLYYGRRFYKPSTGTWPNRDPMEEEGGINLYGFVCNNPINCFDPFGFKDYKLGTADPTITPDAGAGTWNSETATAGSIAMKGLMAGGITVVWVGMPDAVNHLWHYFDNSGSDYTIRLQGMVDEVPSAKRVYNGEIALAQAFVESLPCGKHQITSGSASGGYNRKSESKNWFYAVGGYSAWGKGNATVGKDEYTLEYEYKFYDRYNWDAGKSVTIMGVTVTDAFMGDFHRQGLAREFDMRGSIKKTAKWKKGQAPQITDGWASGGGP
jgi:RHS repeat-associated protein